jgi:tRNA G10  N-methylase Trm11
MCDNKKKIIPTLFQHKWKSFGESCIKINVRIFFKETDSDATQQYFPLTVYT